MKKGRLDCKPMIMPTGVNCLNGKWITKEWNETENLTGSNVWSANGHTYLSAPSGSYVLNGDTWEPKTWGGTEVYYGSMVWTDGADIYYVTPSGDNYVLNGDTWEPKTWGGTPPGAYTSVWSDGVNIYHSPPSILGGSTFVLQGETWEPKTWGGTVADAGFMWSDGTDIYLSDFDTYILHGDTFEKIQFSGGYVSGGDVWSDGKNVFGRRSNAGKYEPVVQNGTTWEPVFWDSPGEMADGGSCYWSDGTNIYYSGLAYDENGVSSIQHYVFVQDQVEPIDPTSMLMGWQVGRQIATQRGKK